MQSAKYKSLINFFKHFILLHKYKFVGLFLTSTLYAISTAASPYLIKLIVDNIVQFKGDPKDIYSVVFMPVALYITLRVLLSFFMRVEDIMQVYTIPATKAQIRESMFQYTIGHDYIFFQDNLSGSISNKILNMANSFERIYIAIHDGLFPCILTFIISDIMMYRNVPSFALFFTVWFFLSLVVTSYLSTRSVLLSDQRSYAESAVAGNIVDVFRNINTVMTFLNKKTELNHMDLVQKNELLAARKLEWELIKIHLFRSLATTIMLSSMLIILIEGWRRGLVTIGDFTFVSSTAFNMAHLTWSASKEFVTLYKEWGIARQSFSLLDTSYSNLDSPEAKPLKVSTGKISFKNVDFKYCSGQTLFENQNITILPGQKIGLVGFSGSGKTTFAKLIMRFYEPQNGNIEIDGQDLKNVTVKSIRENVAMIPQDPGLFNRSILENILYGNPRASYQEVLEAANIANCTDFISELPQGYNTIIGEHGEGLSAGQRQRIAIARAAIKDAPILILDEATSALDSITEQKIQQSIDTLMQNKTAIVIAHRLSTIVNLDRILVFDKGRIVEDGTHQELLAKKGYYAKLWQIQTNDIILA